MNNDLFENESDILPVQEKYEESKESSQLQLFSREPSLGKSNLRMGYGDIPISYIVGNYPRSRD